MFAKARADDVRSGRRDRREWLRINEHPAFDRVVDALTASRVGFDPYGDGLFADDRLREVVELAVAKRSERVAEALGIIGEKAVPDVRHWKRGWFDALLAADAEHDAWALFERELGEVLAEGLALVSFGD